MHLVEVLKTPFQRTEVELTLAMNENLTKFLRLLNNPSGILQTHTGQSRHHLLGLLLVDGADGTGIFRLWELHKVVFPVDSTLIQGIAGTAILQLGSTADVTCLELADLLTISTRAYEECRDMLV